MRIHVGGKLAILVGLGLFTAGCGGSFSFSFGGVDIETPAGDLIRGELSEQLELGEQTPDCTIPEDPELGTEFTCTGTLEDGRVITYDGIVTEDDTFTLSSINTLDSDLFETEFHSQILLDNPGAALSVEGVECGTGTLVIVDETFDCDVTPDGEAALLATVTMPDTQVGSYEYIIN